MQFIVYWLIYPFLLLLSILPLRLLYVISRVLYFLIYYIIGYRKKVVLDNLKLAFPDKPSSELKQIRKKFFKHLSEITVETIKTLSISDNELQKRFVITNPECIKTIEGLNKSVLVMFGHYASWEWTIAVQKHLNFKGYAVYKPLKNKYFNNLVKRIRSRFKTTLISTKETAKTIKRNTLKGQLSTIGILSDQSPKLQDATYWTTFFNHEVPTFTGPEVLAKRLDLTVVHLKVTKLKQGYYSGTFEILSDNASRLPKHEITSMFINRIEKQIKEAPEFYFWTHKRWKHKR